MKVRTKNAKRTLYEDHLKKSLSFFYVFIIVIAVCFNFSFKGSKRNAVIARPQTDTTFKGDHGFFTDERDKKKYSWVRVGKQIWMAENLRYRTWQGCYAYKKNWKKAEKEGYLYDWQTAKSVAPKGWHLPSKAEYQEMMQFVSGSTDKKIIYESLKTDSFGLKFKTNGSYWADDNRYIKGLPMFRKTELWTSTWGPSAKGDTLITYFLINKRSGEAGCTFPMKKYNGQPIRCVRSVE